MRRRKRIVIPHGAAAADVRAVQRPDRLGEAWMTDEGDGSVAHSGCVYRDEEPDARERLDGREQLGVLSRSSG